MLKFHVHVSDSPSETLDDPNADVDMEDDKEDPKSSVSSEKKRAIQDHSSSQTDKKKGKKTELLYDEFRNPSDGKMLKELQFGHGLARDKNPPLPDTPMYPPQDSSRDLLPATSNRRCAHCKFRGNFCHNKRYGRYCILATIRYRRKAKNRYTDELAKAAFIELYAYAFEFEHFLQRCAIPTEMKTKVPQCMMESSFAIALMANDWIFFLHGLEKAVEISRQISICVSDDTFSLRS